MNHKMNHKPTIHNGQGSTSFGAARIVISPKGEIRPVAKAVRSGYRNRQGTEQTFVPGDLVFECTSDRRGQYDAVYRIKNADGELAPLKPVAQGDKWDWLRSLPQGATIEEWLAEGYTTGRTSMFLPDGIGWNDGKTLADIAKERRVERFFAGVEAEFLAKLIRRAAISPWQAVKTNWDDARIMCPDMEFYEFTHDGSCVNIDESTQWVLWHKDGRVEVVDHAPTSGGYRSNYAHHPQGDYDEAPLPMPDTAIRAACVHWGAHTTHHDSYGVSWTLYKRGGKEE
jgi:hypothetical protein